ncbi:Na+/H+ antiporter subunit E [Virgibacillus sp. W0181]|uniref:Na+/H+ antiporter subunit E n=1 Tax=Virgibacillus sp. W0181 TaxID=3391581 RepID=UPI003F44FD8A
MTFQIVVNLIISFMWMFLSETYSFSSFIFGYLLGIVLILILDRFFPSSFYLVRVYSIIKLIFIFFRELILSNIDVVRLVYKRKPDIEPGIFAMPTELKTNWEITLLANLITLTPGTMSVAISEDDSIIFIHAMHIDEVHTAIYDIKNTFEKAIMEVTR